MSALGIGLIGCPPVARLAVVRPARRTAAAEAHAVASRCVAHAEQFARAHGVPVVYPGYRELLDDDDVHAVYIALPNHLHARWAAAALERGKHVLVEKPLCLSAGEAEGLAARARSVGCGLMEAVTTATHPWLDDVCELVDSATLGRLTHVAVRLSFHLDAQRLAARQPREHGGGAFRDCAPYWLQIVQATCGLTGTADSLEVWDDEHGADVDAFATVRLASGAEAVLEASHAGPYEASARFTFVAGALHMPNLFRANVARCKLTVERLDGAGRPSSRSAYGPFDTFELQFADFLQMANSREPWTWVAPALERARMTDALVGMARPGRTCQPVGTDVVPRSRRRCCPDAAEDDGDA